ncbi:MAG: hypothetical protein M3R65_04335 [Gemmatimonadota bacterium]|nr:hypothetical protein [Gemmatimonadota bacterium]
MRPTLLVDRSDWARFEVSGAHAAPTLNGLVTNDVAALRPGTGQYAAALTAKARIVADLVILMLDDRLQLHASPAAAEGLRAMLAKFINPRFATLGEITDVTSELALVGADAAGLLALASGGTADADLLAALPPYSHISVAIGATPVTVVRLPAMGAEAEPAYSVISPRVSASALRAALHSAGARDGEADSLEVLRVETGVPAWGIDMDGSTLPQEANLDEMHAVSYTKGCYIGQETVARIHFRGHVNRSLRRLAFSGESLPPRGAVLQDAEHRAVGDVRSTARSQRQGLIGIGMVRREIEDSASIEVHWDSGTASAVISGKARGAID